MLIDIVILPPENIRNKVGGKMKKEVGKSPNFFIVDNEKLIPHLSLWHMKTSSQRLEKIAEKLKRAVRGTKPIKISSAGFRTLEKYKGDVEFEAKNTSGLKALQKRVVNNVFKFKTGPMPKFAPFLKIKYSKEKLNDIKEYGRSLGFHPHFTMGWLNKDKDVLRVVKNMQKVKFSFLAKEVYITEVDKWWQVKRIIKKIDFK